MGNLLHDSGDATRREAREMPQLPVDEKQGRDEDAAVWTVQDRALLLAEMPKIVRLALHPLAASPARFKAWNCAS